MERLKSNQRPGKPLPRKQQEVKDKTAGEWIKDFQEFYREILGWEMNVLEPEILLTKEEAIQKLGAEHCGVRAIVIPKDLKIDEILEGAKKVVDSVRVEEYENYELSEIGDRDVEKPYHSLIDLPYYEEFGEDEDEAGSAGIRLVWVRNFVGEEDGVAVKDGRRYVYSECDTELRNRLGEKRDSSEASYRLIPEKEDRGYSGPSFIDQLEGIGRFISLREEVVNQLKLLKENPNNLISYSGIKCSDSIDRRSEDNIYSVPSVWTSKDQQGKIHLVIEKMEYIPYGYISVGHELDNGEENKWPSRVVAC